MKWIWYSLIVLVVLLGLYATYAAVDIIRSSDDSASKDKRLLYEQGYFEGQRDALDGDFRIRKIDNRKYVWIKTPYSDSTKPLKDTFLTSGQYKLEEDAKAN